VVEIALTRSEVAEMEGDDDAALGAAREAERALRTALNARVRALVLTRWYVALARWGDAEARAAAASRYAEILEGLSAAGFREPEFQLRAARAELLARDAIPEAIEAMGPALAVAAPILGRLGSPDGGGARGTTGRWRCGKAGAKISRRAPASGRPRTSRAEAPRRIPESG